VVEPGEVVVVSRHGLQHLLVTEPSLTDKMLKAPGRIDVQAAILEQQLRGQFKYPKITGANAPQDSRYVWRRRLGRPRPLGTDAAREGKEGILAAALLSRIGIGELGEVIGELAANVFGPLSRPLRPGVGRGRTARPGARRRPDAGIMH
jgi:hypothetical protein